MARRIGVDIEKRNKRQAEWRDEHQDRIYLLVPKGKKDEWREKATAEGKNLNQYIIDKVESRD